MFLEKFMFWAARPARRKLKLPPHSPQTPQKVQPKKSVGSVGFRIYENLVYLRHSKTLFTAQSPPEACLLNRDSTQQGPVSLPAPLLSSLKSEVRTLWAQCTCMAHELPYRYKIGFIPHKHNPTDPPYPHGYQSSLHDKLLAIFFSKSTNWPRWHEQRLFRCTYALLPNNYAVKSPGPP